MKLLQQLHDKLTRKLAPAKAIDPFTVLPVELVEMILSYLPFRNMVNCLRVSKSWKQYLVRYPQAEAHPADPRPDHEAETLAEPKPCRRYQAGIACLHPPRRSLQRKRRD